MKDKILLLKGQIRSDLRNIFYSSETKKYQVIFTNGRQFFYNPENVEYLSKGEDLLTPIRVTRVSDGIVFQNVLGVTTFISDRTKEIKAYRIVFENGEHRDYPASEVLVEKHVKGERAKNVFHYLRDLSNFSHFSLDEDTTIGLFQKYARVSMISEISPLADYLVADKALKSGSILSKKAASQSIIFPFGCNRSQYNAVRLALSNKLSVIQGPPGTGKTQTILNIVANLIISGKSVEIVSNNNSAVLNVAEKMAKDKYSLSWLVAYLGNSSNKNVFYDGQSGFYPNHGEWASADLDSLKTEISILSYRLQNGYDNLERIAQLRENLRQLEAQSLHLTQNGNDIGASLKVTSSKEALDLIEFISQKLDTGHRFGLFARLKLRRKGIKNPVTVLPSLEIIYYRNTIEEIRSRISSIEADVQNIQANEK